MKTKYTEKMLGYAYPTSELADKWGYPEGCYYAAKVNPVTRRKQVEGASPDRAKAWALVERMDLPLSKRSLPKGGNESCISSKLK